MALDIIRSLKKKKGEWVSLHDIYGDVLTMSKGSIMRSCESLARIGILQRKKTKRSYAYKIE